MTSDVGRVLGGRYKLLRPVGQGSQAAVWVAEHLALRTHCAVKLLDPALAQDATALDRFRREATAASQLRSPHVVQVLDHGIDEGQPFMVLELLEGEDLFDRLAQRGTLTLAETAKILSHVGRALTKAHAAGIIHRDLKPENIFLVNNDDDDIIKVLDFGVAKIIRDDASRMSLDRTRIGALIGTPHYMAPEQVRGAKDISPRIDLWSMGVIAYQCLTGTLPFDSASIGDLLVKITLADAVPPSQLAPGLPPSIDAWFAHSCAIDPTARFTSAREQSDAFAYAAGLVTTPASPSIPAPKPEATKPRPVMMTGLEIDFNAASGGAPQPGVPLTPAPASTPATPVASARPRPPAVTSLSLPANTPMPSEPSLVEESTFTPDKRFKVVAWVVAGLTFIAACLVVADLVSSLAEKQAEQGNPAKAKP